MSVADNFHEFSSKPENLDFSNTQKIKDKLTTILKGLTEWLKNAPNRESLPNFVFVDMLGILARLSHALYKSLKDEPKSVDKTLQMVDLATECFRTLRNSCAGCKKNQEEVLKNPGLYWIAANILSTLVNTPKSSPMASSQEGKNAVIQCLRCGVQFLGNAAAGFDESKSFVWGSVFGTIRPLLKAEDATLANYTCMLIYTCLTSSNMGDLMGTKEGVTVITAVMHHFSKHETEWGLYIMEKLLAHPSFVETSYKMLPDKDKTTLMSFVSNKLHMLEEKDGRNHSSPRDGQLEIKIALGNIQFASQEFQAKAHVILNLKKLKELESMEPVMVGKLLEVLCSATSTSHYKELQQEDGLLKCAISALQSMHVIGKQGDNVFSQIGKVSEAGKANPSHPAFGLKRDLIRLVGNLVHKHKRNQNLVRELGGIPLLLDHTNIDARNPFISQWSILAVRHLCENNPENQAVISGLKLEGVANPGLLTELGITAKVEGEKVTVKQAGTKNKSR